MADKVSNYQTTLPSDDVLVRAVQFFSTEKFTTSSQSNRSVTFQGKPPFPCGMLILTFLAYLLFIIPGLILHFTLLRKLYRFHNLVVTVTAAGNLTAITVSYPSWAAGQVRRFLASLPSQSTEITPT